MTEKQETDGFYNIYFYMVFIAKFLSKRSTPLLIDKENLLFFFSQRADASCFLSFQIYVVLCVDSFECCESFSLNF
jgi:hypothetical protein